MGGGSTARPAQANMGGGSDLERLPVDRFLALTGAEPPMFAVAAALSDHASIDALVTVLWDGHSAKYESYHQHGFVELCHGLRST
jgi:hypothetical protein